MHPKEAGSANGHQARLEGALSKRMRELDCLYNLLTVFEAPDLGLEEVFQGIVDIIVSGWQHSGQACARLTMDGRAWQTGNFRDTPWRQSEPIIMHGQPAGSLEVGYLTPLPEADEGPFLVEERVLLEVVAGRLSRFVERRRYGQQVTRQRDFAQGLVETAQAIVLVLDQAGRIEYFNSFLEKLTGYRQAEVRGHDWREVFLPGPLDENQAAYFRPGGDQGPRQSCLVPIRDSRGGLWQVEWRNRTLPNLDGSPGQMILCTGQDLTRRLELEAERYRLAAVVEQSVDAVDITDTRGVIIYVNQAYARLFGLNHQELLGCESPLLTQLRQNQALLRQISSELDAGRSWSGRHVIKHDDGQELEVETHVSPIRDQSDTVTNYYARHRDITQEQKVRDHLRQSHKMEAIGTLAGGIAHDFNNILGGISGYVELARMFMADTARATNYLDQALKAGERAKELVRQILTFSRQTEQQKKPLDLAEEVREALRLVRATLPTTIEITQNFSAPQATVLADSTQIQQVVLNLCTNAAHAMRERGGHLDVALHLVHLDEKEAQSYPGLSVGPYLRLSVSDSGHGMPREVVERIFEPFFTTKAQGEGTGLGLAVVHGIVSSYQGIIKVYSQPGKGSVFHVMLPCQSYSKVSEAAQAPDIPGGGEKILVVDDEEDLVDIQRSLLSSLGYQVSAFVSSEEALAYFKTHPGQFDLVLTDLTMPGLTGLDLAQAMLAINPHLPVILCTGFSESSTLDAARSLGVSQVLFKPVLRGDLGRAVRQTLDEHSQGAGPAPPG